MKVVDRKALGLPLRTPVEDATAPIYVNPQMVDVQGAKRDDPMNCAYAKAFKRIYGYTAIVNRTTAYVPLMGPRGRPVIKRFMVTVPAQRALEYFDRTGEMPEHGLEFRPPGRSERRGARRPGPSGPKTPAKRRARVLGMRKPVIFEG